MHRAVTQPIARPVAADDARFLATKGAAKLAFRLARRSVELAASGQRRFEARAIDPAWKRALWIHAEAPQIGDALMDLAPRSLLVEHGIAVDLLAPEPIASLFCGDPGFGRVLAGESEIAADDHDFVIVDSRSWKALAAKRRHAPALPWVSIKGDYLGYDYQRALFATRRLAELLGVTLDDAAERRHARQKLGPAGETGAWREPSSRVAIALGGVRAERSYAHWAGVAETLVAAGVRRFTLLGSANARGTRSEVMARLAHSGHGDVDVLDLVDAANLHGTRAAIAAARLALCADGGLMHLALTTATPLVALFDASIDPAWRLPPGFAGTALRAPFGEVSTLAPESAANAALGYITAG